MILKTHTTMKKIYMTCLACLVYLLGVAQVPGYMGKRFVAGYGFYFSPALIGTNGLGASIIGTRDGNAETGTIAFNSLHELFAEYTVGKKLSLGLSARIYRSAYDNNRTLTVDGSFTDPYGYQQTYSASGHPDGLYHIRGVNYLLYGKLYFGKFLAPWGRYFMFGPSLNTYSTNYSPDEMKILAKGYGNNNVFFSDFGPQQQRFVKFDIMAGLGRSRILANRICLDYGFNVNIIALYSTLFDATGESLFDSSYPSQYNYIQKTSPGRVRGVNRFNAFIKVGVLLF